MSEEHSPAPAALPQDAPAAIVETVVAPEPVVQPPVEAPASPSPPAAPAEPTAAPVAPEPSPPAPEPISAPEPVAEAPAATEEAKPAEEAKPDALKPHTDEPGLLSPVEPPKDGEKPPEKTETTEKPAETAESVEEVKYEFVLPEGTELSAEPLENFTNLAKEHKIAPEVAQNLVDMHIGAMNAYREATLQAQHDAFAEYRREGRNQIMADPELGGSGFKTNQQTAIEMLKLFTPAEHREELDNDLRASGMADRRSFFRLMVNIARSFKEPAPVPAQTPRQPIPGAAGRPAAAGNSRLPYAYPRGRSRGVNE